METKRLFRSRRDKMIGGVCGGLASYFVMDPTVVRLIFVLLALFGGPGLILYIILWIITPVEP
jgi:phage shock protein C